MAEFEYFGPLEEDVEYVGPLEEEPPPPESFGKKALGVAEAGLNALSGAVSWIPSGIIKAAGLVSGQLPEASVMGDEIQEALTYEPRTETGKALSGYIAKPFEWISERGTEAGEAAYGATGSPLMGAAAKTAIEAIPFVAPVTVVKGLRGLKSAGRAKESLAPEKPVEVAPERPTVAFSDDMKIGPAPEEIVEPGADLKGKQPPIKPETLEVMVKGGSTGALPKYAEGSAINLERLDTTQDIKQFQNIMTKAAESEIGKRKVSWEETEQAAKDLAWDDKEFLKQAQKKDGFSAAEIQAMRQIHTNSLHDLFNTIKEMPADYSLRTETSRLEVLDKLNNYVEVMKETSRHSSEAGRALNIHKKLIGEDPAFREDAYRKTILKEMMDSLGGTELTDAMIDDLRAVDFKNPQAVREVVQKYHKSGLFDKVYEAWLNSILSAPASHAANILGNTLSLMTKVPESAIKSAVSGKSPIGPMKAESVGMWQGLKEGIRAATHAFKTGVPSDMLAKIEHQRYAAIPGKAGEMIRIPTRALTAADEFFKSIIYRSELNKQAYEIAKGEGLTGNAIAERMTKIINDPTDLNFRNIHTTARNESLYRTFNKPLGKLGQSVMGMRTKIPGLRYVVPFIRTPINIAKFALERTPFAFPKSLYEFRKGKIGVDELNADLSKSIVGSLLAAATTMAVVEGNITGAPPKNKKDRDLLYATGWQPYSLKIGDKYYSYNRLEPIGSVVGMTADFVDAMRDDDSEINEKAGKIILSFSRNIASKTYLTSISGLLDAISDPERSGGAYVEKMAGSLIPSGVAAISRATDKYVREAETPLEAVKARVPGLSKTLPVKVGAFEIPIERPGNAAMRLLSPVQISKERPDMEVIAGSEIAQRKLERGLAKLQKKTRRELLRQARTY